MYCPISEADVDSVPVGPDYVQCPHCGSIFKEATMEQYFRQQAPRASSLPALEGEVNPEWYITEDGVPFAVGHTLFDYYDMRWVTVATEPNSYDGWFNVENNLGQRAGTLNSVRVSSKPPSWYKGD